MKYIYLLLPLAGLYIATRSKYKIPSFNVFIPNTGLFTGKQEEDKESIVSKIYDAINISITTDPSLGWIFSLKPINGVEIPVNVWLPWDFPIAYPQVKNEIGNKIRIDPKKLGNTTLGYNVVVEEIEFYA